MKNRNLVLVTGASGQLGSEIRDLSTATKSLDFVFLDRSALDLTDLSNIAAVLEKYSPNMIVHAAAYTAVDEAEEDVDQAFLINHLATKAIAEYARLHEVKIIFISTDYVFSGNLQEALLEDRPTAALNVYGASKVAAETAVMQLLPTAIIIRTSWVYSRYGKNFVKTMLRLMEQLPKVQVVNDQFGSPTYAYDLAKAIISILEAKHWIPGIYHYSNEGAITWYEFALAIRDLARLDCQVLPVDSSKFPSKAKRPTYSILSKEKIKENYFLTIPHWKDSLQEMLKTLVVKKIVNHLNTNY